MKNEEIEEEQDYLFSEHQPAPIPFNGDVYNDPLHGEIQRLITVNNFTVPILHIDDQEYLIGSQLMDCELKNGQALVVVGKGTENFDKYVGENHDFFERSLVT